jgi:hypothetical protein
MANFMACKLQYGVLKRQLLESEGILPHMKSVLFLITKPYKDTTKKKIIDQLP